MTPREALQVMVMADRDPPLSDVELQHLLDLSRMRDANGVVPGVVGWVPTYDLNRAAAEGWRWKAGLVAERVNWNEAEMGIQRAQFFDHCMRMSKAYSRKVLSSVRPGVAVGYDLNAIINLNA